MEFGALVLPRESDIILPTLDPWAELIRSVV
jgi:hypothetical protein